VSLQATLQSQPQVLHASVIGEFTMSLLKHTAEKEHRMDPVSQEVSYVIQPQPITIDESIDG
jgi:hypothetical protein